MPRKKRPLPGGTNYYSLSLNALRERSYQATLSLIMEFERGADDFRSFLVSYLSDGLKVYAKVNIPTRPKTPSGYPVVVFLHGFSPDPTDPDYFRRPYYETWVNAYSRAGFLTIMPGYRGHGVVEGMRAEGSEYLERYSPLYLTSPFYAIDVLNLLAGLDSSFMSDWAGSSIDPPVSACLDRDNLFLSAHSMGGDVALIVLAATEQFRAASLWAAVAAGIKDVARFYIQYELPATNSEELLHGMLVERMRKISLATRSKPFQLHNIDEWSGFFALQQITTPIILHHGTQDTVPYKWSVRLDCELKKLDRESTLFLYKGNDHELSLNNEHALAIERDVEFFKNHLR